MPARSTSKPQADKHGHRYTVHDIVTVASYRGMSRGDRVNVVDARGGKIPGRYEFHSYKVNVTTGKAWIDVYGGPASKSVVWPYAVDRVKKVDSRRKS